MCLCVWVWPCLWVCVKVHRECRVIISLGKIIHVECFFPPEFLGHEDRNGCGVRVEAEQPATYITLRNLTAGERKLLP